MIEKHIHGTEKESVNDEVETQMPSNDESQGEMVNLLLIDTEKPDTKDTNDREEQGDEIAAKHDAESDIDIEREVDANNTGDEAEKFQLPL